MAKKGKKDKINKIEQSVEETTQAINTEEFKGLTYGEDYVEDPNITRTLVESPTTVLLDIPQEITIVDNFSNEQAIIDALPEMEFINEPIEIKIDIASKRTIESLTKDEFRMYQRTGRLPE